MKNESSGSADEESTEIENELTEAFSVIFFFIFICCMM